VKSQARPRPAINSDVDIQHAALRALERDTHVKATDVGVSVHVGVVTLTGMVSTYAERVAAQAAAHRVAGVLDVANDLQVRIPGMLNRTDTEIALAVRRALGWDAPVPHEHIESTVSDGWVTLTGSVDSGSQREDAERAVRKLVGVCGVINELVVQGPLSKAEDVPATTERCCR
jgi:osmotically-inducible protein OsmY